MVKTLLNNVRLTGVSVVVPGKELSLTDDPDLYGGDQRRIQRVINSSGFLKRRIADPDVTTADLCEQAAQRLIREMEIDRESIDALVFISYTPDYLMPATSYVLHKKLELKKDCIAMDMPQACSGFVFGIYQAGLLLNGGCRRVLILVGDTFSKFSDMFIDHTAPVFGDAGSAALLEYDETADPVYFNIQSCGANYDALICENGGFRNIPVKSDFYEDGSYRYRSKMDGGRIFEFTMREIAPSIKELFEFSSVSKDQVDYFVMHQANRFILENIARLLDADPSKMPMETLSEYGNQCGASIPCAIAHKLRKEVSKHSLQLLMCGFGVGLNWVSVLIRTKEIYCPEVAVYERPLND